MATPEETLQKYFGHATFRFNQRQIIDSVIGGQDVLAILPTGGGKSVCYQVPGLILGGTTIVVSPLISLMKDQVDQLQKKGVSAAFINSSLSEAESTVFFANFVQQKYQFIYVAPERLKSPAFLQACRQVAIPLIAIDEAHCVSQWGHDFRPSYLLIHHFIASFQQRPMVMALTATATPKVQAEITQFTGLKHPQIFMNSFKRENLHLVNYLCSTETEKILWLLRLWQRFQNQKILMYCATRLQTVYYTDLAKKFGFACSFYHAGLENKTRAEIQTRFSQGQIKIIAATNAFGMGIDIPDIRLVIHLQLPQNVEGYYQEIGRAGRDGREAWCYLLHTLHDQEIADDIFEKKFSPEQKQQHDIAMNQRHAVQHIFEKEGCRLQVILEYFGERNAENCQKCDNCQPKQRVVPTEELDCRKKLWQRSQKEHVAFSKSFPGSIPTSVIKFLALHQAGAEHSTPGVGRGFTEFYASMFMD